MTVLETADIVFECETSGVGGFATVLQNRLANLGIFKNVTVHINIVVCKFWHFLSIEIIPVEVLLELHDLIPGIIALVVAAHGVVEEYDAVVLDPCLIEVDWNDIEVHQKLWVHGPDIRGPVGGSVTDHNTSQVVLNEIWIIEIPELGLLIILVDLPGEVWGVDSTVTLATDVQFIILLIWSVLRESVVPLLEGGEGILRLEHIIVNPLGLINVPWGEAYTGWGLQVDNVGVFVPWIRVLNNFTSTIFEYPWAVFLHECEH